MLIAFVLEFGTRMKTTVYKTTYSEFAQLDGIPFSCRLVRCSSLVCSVLVVFTVEVCEPTCYVRLHLVCHSVLIKDRGLVLIVRMHSFDGIYGWPLSHC